VAKATTAALARRSNMRESNPHQPRYEGGGQSHWLLRRTPSQIRTGTQRLRRPRVVCVEVWWSMRVSSPALKPVGRAAAMPLSHTPAAWARRASIPRPPRYKLGALQLSYLPCPAKDSNLALPLCKRGTLPHELARRIDGRQTRTARERLSCTGPVRDARRNRTALEGFAGLHLASRSSHRSPIES
jgi:hypothetical protein